MGALESAAREYLLRSTRQHHPLGVWRNEVWLPDAGEMRPCCHALISRPSKVFPLPLMRHCRTYEHVAALYGVDALALKRLVRITPAPFIGNLEVELINDHR
jgi:hypothetical protein